MTSSPKRTGPLKLGTRGSPLALAQARMVANALITAHGWNEGDVTIIPITTTGDKVQDRALADIGGKALWTKELDIALDEGRIDFAVHSMKDVETLRPSEITIAAMLPRADVRDRLIGAPSIEALKNGARVGTSSPRRAAQLLHLRPDLEILLFRGNVATRLRKLAEGEADATLLAAAGLDRLGEGEVGVAIDTEVMLPAPAQGAIGIETRTADVETFNMLSAINDDATYRTVMTERALLEGLGGTCRSPIAALATIETDGRICLRAKILSADGKEIVHDVLHMNAADARSAAHELGLRLLDRASPALRALFDG